MGRFVHICSYLLPWYLFIFVDICWYLFIFVDMFLYLLIFIHICSYLFIFSDIWSCLFKSIGFRLVLLCVHMGSDRGVLFRTGRCQVVARPWPGCGYWYLFVSIDIYSHLFIFVHTCWYVFIFVDMCLYLLTCFSYLLIFIDIYWYVGTKLQYLFKSVIFQLVLLYVLDLQAFSLGTVGKCINKWVSHSFHIVVSVVFFFT